ncbi:MAG: hypothetical protein ABJA90_10355 [Ginsengibacter sp.]
MKKIIIALLFIAGTFGIANGQTKEKKVTKVSTPVTTTTTKISTTTATPAKAGIQKSTIRPTLKKDGTPDKRFKENKVTATTTKIAGPIKKDGTADMRYKKNQSEKK